MKIKSQMMRCTGQGKEEVMWRFHVLARRATLPDLHVLSNPEAL